MNFGKSFGLILLWVGCGIAARAQFGVYAGYNGTHLSGIHCMDYIGTQNACSSTGDQSSTTATSDSVNPSGLFVGGYYDFRNVGPVRLGADLRYIGARSNRSASVATGGKNATSVDTVLAGLRGTVRTPISWIKPYGELAAGRTYTDAATGTGVYANYVQYQVMAGVDLRITSILDLRAIELGIGNMNQIGSSAVTGTSSVGVRSIGAGVVLHFP